MNKPGNMSVTIGTLALFLAIGLSIAEVGPAPVRWGLIGLGTVAVAVGWWRRSRYARHKRGGRMIPRAFIFMKVGSHAGESLDGIVERKQRELSKAGKTLWGYGGNGPCHPKTQVQPFAQKWGNPLYVLMSRTKAPVQTRHSTRARRATKHSADQEEWSDLKGFVVTGSKFAFVLDKLQRVDFDLNLEDFEVGFGAPGRNAANFFRGQTSRGCLVATDATGVNRTGQASPVRIELCGRLVPPYAVFLQP